MVAVPSTMLPLGQMIPSFNLPDVVTGQRITPETFEKNQLLVIMFICEHCPFVKHVQLELAKLGKDYVPKNVGILAISSNDIEKHPDDAPEKLKRMAENLGFNFHYAYDETQAVAKAFKAACTPDFYLFDSERHLIYRGQLDDSRPNNGLPVTGKDLRYALDKALAHEKNDQPQKPSIGCNIKWKPGQAPDYFGN